MKTIFACPKWGMDFSDIDAACGRIKAAGYDAIETWVDDDERKNQLIAALEKHQLQLIAQQATLGDTLDEFLSSMEAQVENALDAKPLLLNFHAGRDWWPIEDNITIAKKAVELSKKHKIDVTFEIHRGRMTFCGTQTMALLDAVPELTFTADFSHWCCVSESLLDDQQHFVDRAITNSRHLHARVGFQQGPQINDPRVPEHADTVERFCGWWDAIRAAHEKAQAPFMTITPEFGPDPYMPEIPFTRQPITSQWDVNIYMMNMLKERWGIK